MALLATNSIPPSSFFRMSLSKIVTMNRTDCILRKNPRTKRGCAPPPLPLCMQAPMQIAKMVSTGMPVAWLSILDGDKTFIRDVRGCPPDATDCSGNTIWHLLAKLPNITPLIPLLREALQQDGGKRVA